MGPSVNEEPYSTLPGLESVYLEDSWVLSIGVTPGMVRFELDAVLLRQHAAYHPPKPGEAHCYRRATLTFGHVSSVEWRAMGTATVDATGEIDYGNIDTLTRSGEHFHLAGDWGDMRILAGSFAWTLSLAEGEA